MFFKNLFQLDWFNEIDQRKFLLRFFFFPSQNLHEQDFVEKGVLNDWRRERVRVDIYGWEDGVVRAKAKPIKLLQCEISLKGHKTLLACSWPAQQGYCTARGSALQPAAERGWHTAAAAGCWQMWVGPLIHWKNVKFRGYAPKFHS